MLTLIDSTNVVKVRVLLQRFLTCRGNADADRLLDTLIRDHVDPIAMGVIARRSSDPQERRTIYLLAIHRIVQRLNALRKQEIDAALAAADRSRSEPSGRHGAAAPDAEIRDFPAFVRMAARQAFSTYLNEKRPERKRLYWRVRYLLKHAEQLSTWQSPAGITLCGLSKWWGEVPADRSARLELLRDDPEAAVQQALLDFGPYQENLAPMVGALMLWVGGPMELETLVDALSRIFGLQYDAVSLEGMAGTADQPWRTLRWTSAAAPACDIETVLQQRAFLADKWSDIRKLPLLKRRALLLSGRDDRDECVAVLLHTLEIATYREIAEVLALSWEEFTRLWSDLPLADSHIAVIAGTSPGNVRVQRWEARKLLSARRGAVDSK